MLHKKISFPDSFRLFFLRAKKAGWAASEGFVSPILQLALTPFLLHELGKFEFGTWVLVLTFWSLGPLLSFAAAAATFNRLSEQVAGNNEKSVVDTLRTGALLGIFATLSSGVVVAIIYAIYAFQYGVAIEYKFLSTLIFLAGVALLLQELDGVLICLPK
jgi:O-antigen/teichoic acid export membrane protein